jgi:hypothetical protein
VTPEDLTLAYIEAIARMRGHLRAGDRWSRVALQAADRARANWECGRDALREAQDLAKEMARLPNGDHWPEGLEASILAALDDRDSKA